MNRTKLWSALLLAATASTGCGSLPTMEGAASKAGVWSGAKPARMAERAGAAPPGPSGLNFVQANVLPDLTLGNDSSVTVGQSNLIATLLLDDPKELLDHYAEVPGQVVWDRTTRTFFLTQLNLAGGIATYSDASFQQLNRLFILVDPRAKYYGGTIIQLNAVGSVSVEAGTQATIDQINDVYVIHRDEDGPDADDFVAALLSSPPDPVASSQVLKQQHEQIIYLDGLGRPHLYQWVAPTGKNGMGNRRRR